MAFTSKLSLVVNTDKMKAIYAREMILACERLISFSNTAL